MSFNLAKAKREWWIHQIYTWIAFIALSVIVLIFFGVGARFFKPQAMFMSVASIALFQFIIWLFSERIVCALTNCKPAEGAHKERLERLLQTFIDDIRLTPPRLYVSTMDKPNAFAFGTGLFGEHAVAVTEDLLTLMNDDEIAAVLAHECGHLKARDTSLMLFVSVLLGACDLLARRLRNIGGLGIGASLALQAALYIPKVVSKGISQLREYGADCFAAIALESITPMISALQTLEGWYRTHSPEDETTKWLNPLDELMLSHPKMASRVEMLRSLQPTPNTETKA